MEKIFTDENTKTTSPSLQIDFSKALWATDALYEIFHDAGVPLNDVDFIAETDEELIFVECKNANRIDVLISKRLPFELQLQNLFQTKMIDAFYVISINEWNDKYPQFSITRLVKEICQN